MICVDFVVDELWSPQFFESINYSRHLLLMYYKKNVSGKYRIIYKENVK